MIYIIFIKNQHRMQTGYNCFPDPERGEYLLIDGLTFFSSGWEALDMTGIMG